METYKIDGVEIFSAGTWNGDEYTVDDLQAMVDAFYVNRETVRPFLKLGHDEDQSLIQSDGFPAAGWIERLYIKGEKLVADFVDIPKKIFELIKAKAYRKVSSEIYWNVKIKEQEYKYMLGAVALLGADTPGVMNLSDILAMYSKVVGNDKRVYELNSPFGSEKKGDKMEKTEAEIKLELDLKAKADEIETIKKDYAKAQDEAKVKESELSELRQYKAEAEKKAAELLAEANKAKVEKFCTDLVANKMASVAMKPYVSALLEDKHEYSFGDDKKLSRQDVITEMLKLFKAFAEVNFVENSSTGQENKPNTDDELDKKIKAYSAEKGIPYGAAAKVILSQQTKS